MILMVLSLIFLGALVFVSTSFFDFLWLLTEIIICGAVTVIGFIIMFILICLVIGG